MATARTVPSPLGPSIQPQKRAGCEGGSRSLHTTHRFPARWRSPRAREKPSPAKRRVELGPGMSEVWERGEKGERRKGSRREVRGSGFERGNPVGRWVGGWARADEEAAQ